MSSIAQFRPPQVVADDTELVVSLRRHDADALSAVAERFGPAIGAAAAHLVDDPTSVPDAVARVLAAAWEQVGEIEPGDDLAPWLADLLGPSIGIDDTDQALVDRVWSTRTAIDSLDEGDRELVRLVWTDGVDAERASAQLGLEAATASRRVERSTRRVMQQVAHLATEADVESLLRDPKTWVRDEVSAIRPLADQLTTSADASDPLPARDATPTSRPFVNRSVLAGVIGAVSMVLLLGAGIVAFSAAGDPPAVASFDAEMVPTGLISDIGGDIEVTEVDSGLRIELDAPALPRRSGGAFYEGWLRLVDERFVSVGTFQQGTGVTLSAGVDLALVAEMFVTLGDAVERDAERGGPASPAVLKVDFPAG